MGDLITHVDVLWLRNLIPAVLSRKRFVLVYKGSRDGDTEKAYYDKCTGKGPLIYIVKSSVIDNGGRYHVLGGFRSVKVRKPHGGWDVDKSAFLFSVTKREVEGLSGEIGDDRCVGDRADAIVNFNGFLVATEYHTKIHKGGHTQIKQGAAHNSFTEFNFAKSTNGILSDRLFYFDVLDVEVYGLE